VRIPVADPADAERGSVALFMALFTVGLLAMAGLVIDGGAALAARGHAHDVAAQAARAGADALNPQSLRAASPDGLALDPDAARSAAQRYLSAGGATGTVTIAGQDVTVTAQVVKRATVLSAFGIGELSGRSTASATMLHGTVGDN
jgi:Flp pilus assembly protein TadG